MDLDPFSHHICVMCFGERALTFKPPTKPGFSNTQTTQHISELVPWFSVPRMQTQPWIPNLALPWDFDFLTSSTHVLITDTVAHFQSS